MYLLVSLFIVMGTTIELAIVLAIKRIKFMLCYATILPNTTSTSISDSRNLDDARANMMFAPEKGHESWPYNSERNLNYKSCKRRVFGTTRATNKIDFFAFCLFLFIYVTFSCNYFTKYM